MPPAASAAIAGGTIRLISCAPWLPPRTRTRRRAAGAISAMPAKPRRIGTPVTRAGQTSRLGGLRPGHRGDVGKARQQAVGGAGHRVGLEQHRRPAGQPRADDGRRRDIAAGSQHRAGPLSPQQTAGRPAPSGPGWRGRPAARRCRDRPAAAPPDRDRAGHAPSPAPLHTVGTTDPAHPPPPRHHLVRHGQTGKDVAAAAAAGDEQMRLLTGHSIIRVATR